MPGQNTLRLNGADETARQQRIARQRSEKEAHAHNVASRAAKADRTDPFTYARVYAHIMNGVGEMHAFGMPKEAE